MERRIVDKITEKQLAASFLKLSKCTFSFAFYPLANVIEYIDAAPSVFSTLAAW